jgi:anaerobic ribonucleoside-triphosphate reductase activating protein
MTTLNIAATNAVTEAEGPGRRFAIWTMGCPFRCPDCCNAHLQPLEGGRVVDVLDLLEDIATARREHDIEGVTVIGGEPMIQVPALSQLCAGVQDMGLTVMVFSGYTMAQLRQRNAGPLLDSRTIDILVDGLYRKDMPDTTRRWIGSTNQEVHFLTDRYSMADFAGPETTEILFRDDGSVVSNGWPVRFENGILYLGQVN